MVRLFTVFCLVALLCPLTGASAAQPLRVHAWVDYFPAWLHEEFTRETGIPIVQSFMAENTSLRTALVEHGATLHYDIVTPSSEMLQQLASEGLLLALDREQIPNMADIDPWFSGLGYDKGSVYSVPIFWGVLGIVIDKRVIPAEVASRIKGYKDLWMPELKDKLLLPNDFRSLMSIMLLSLGYGVNDFERLPQAMQALESLLPSVAQFDTVDQLDSMLKGNIGVGVVWARKDYVAKDMEGIFAFIPAKEGSPVWIDTLAVPAAAGNPKAAFAFINFVLRPDILARLGESSGYAVAGKKARELLPEELRNQPALYPPDSLRERFEPELMLPPAADDLMKRWNKLRGNR
ncbi:MAG: spermidine/putrescine ABC transporter substrate-binding protein [Desulfovibrionaceae bacterium]|nr:spermidine/putrescine ABC transporter substrate-binding protein [Desulfovibrionaceae bacterium]